MTDNKRQHFRIVYPKGEGPKLQLLGEIYVVIDISERGLKFKAGPRFKADENTPFKGKITFHDGKSLNLEGTLVRYDKPMSTCVVQLQTPIGLAKIMEEQRYLLKKYGTLD